MTQRRNTLTRRRVLQAGAALGVAGAPSVVYGQSKARITIVGGGFGGAAVAKHLRMLDNTLDVTIIEPNPDYVTCPHSNEVIAGLATMADITVSYGRLAQAYGVRFLRDEVRAVDTTRRKITLGSGSVMDYDRLVLAPGVEMRLDAIEGYNAAALEKMPHAWKAGPQTALLRRQLEAMPDGGTVIVAPPINPSRCPPGPYERASLIAHYLKTHKPKSKILIFDAKDTFPHQETFQSVWDSLYPGMIDWYAASSGGTITKVDPAAMTVTTEFGAQKGNVINIIPQQRAPQFLIDASLVDPWGWCPIEPRTLESTLTRHVSIVGDAANGVVMAKSAMSANAQAKVCAGAIVALLSGRAPEEPSYYGTCYSLIAPDFAVAVTDVYAIGKHPTREIYTIKEILGGRGYTETDFTPEMRRKAAQYARSWYTGIVADTFG